MEALEFHVAFKQAQNDFAAIFLRERIDYIVRDHDLCEIGEYARVSLDAGVSKCLVFSHLFF